MPRCFEDEDFGYPIALLQGTNYALFENGTIAKMVENDEEQGYNFLYSSANQAEITLENPDPISPRIMMLKEKKTFFIYTFSLLILYFLLELKSWSILDFLTSTEFGSTVVIPALLALWLFIGLFPETIYELQTRKFKDSSYIQVKHHLRPQSPKILVERPKGWAEFLPILAYTQRLGIAGSLLLYTPSTEENVLLWGWLGANLFVLSIMVAVLPLALVNSGFFNRQKQHRPDLSLPQFYELTEQKISSWIEENTGNTGTGRSLQELLEHNEDISLEFKLSMWAQYKTKEKVAIQEIVNIGRKKNYVLQDEILESVAAFLNSNGGTLLIGVKDKPKSWGDRPAEVWGIEPDYGWLPKSKQDGEGYINAVRDVLKTGLGGTAIIAKHVRISVEKFSADKEICRIDVTPVPRILHGEVYIKLKSDSNKNEEFFYRIHDSTQHASVKSASRYIRDNFVERPDWNE